MNTMPFHQDARHQIETILFGYAKAVDEGDLDTIARLFERGQIRVDGQSDIYKGGEGVRKMFADFTVFYNENLEIIDPLKERGRPFTQHNTTNLMFEYLNKENARCHTYFTVVQNMPGEPIQTIITGRYEDEFACESGQWYLTDRFEVMNLIGDLSKHLHQLPF